MTHTVAAMVRQTYWVLGAAVALAVGAAGCSSQRQSSEAMRQAHAQAVADFMTQLSATGRVPPGVVVPAPPIPVPQTEFQFCLVNSKSCMELDPRPFALCPAGDAACNDQGRYELLDRESGMRGGRAAVAQRRALRELAEAFDPLQPPLQQPNIQRPSAEQPASPESPAIGQR
jgi:hypothetical protein